MPDQPPSSATSASLLERLQAHQEEAWQRFVHLYGPLLDGWCRQVPLQPADAADISQEVFRCVARAIGEFRPAGQRGAFRAWLRAITRNCVREHFRRQVRQPPAPGGSDAFAQLHQVPDLAEPSDEDNASETVGVVRRALELIQPEFSTSTWRAFSLVSMESRTPDEVAGEVGLSVFAVRQACYRVRRRLRQELNDLDD